MPIMNCPTCGEKINSSMRVFDVSEEVDRMVCLARIIDSVWVVGCGYNLASKSDQESANEIIKSMNGE